MEQNRIETGRDMSRDLTQSKKPPEVLNWIHRRQENLTPLLSAKVIQQIGLIESHEEIFEEFAATKTMDKASGTKTAQEISKNIKMYLKAIWGHFKESNICLWILQFSLTYPLRDGYHLPSNRS